MVRFAEHQARLSHSVIERVSGLAGLSLEVLHDRIKAEKDNIPLGIVKDSAELALKAMGFGPKPAHAPAPVVHINIGAPPELLAEAREDLRRLHVENTEDAEILTEETDIVPKALERAERANDTPRTVFGEV